jgi:hypothetical protein
LISETELELRAQHDIDGTSRIRILLSVPTEVAAAIAVSSENASAVGISTAATIARYVDDAQTVIRSQSGFNALGAVLSKIDVFVDIVDQASTVRCRGSILTTLPYLFSGAPLCQPGVANCVIGV